MEKAMLARGGSIPSSQVIGTTSFLSSSSSLTPAAPSSTTTTTITANANKKNSKNILITGGARGIGRVTARYFLSSSAAQQQHHVFLIDVDAAELAYCVNTHLGAYVDDDNNLRVQGFVADLRDPTQIRNAVHAAAAWFPGGRVDVLVNNAGVGPFWSEGRTMADPATAVEWASILGTNLSGPFLASQAVIPFMKRGSGNANGSSAGTGTNGGDDEQEDEKEKEKAKEEDGGEAMGSTHTSLATAITDTIDTLADAIKTTMHLDGDENSSTTSSSTSSSPSLLSFSHSPTPSASNNNNKDPDRFAPGPSIIHISSFRAHRSDPNSEAYAATKAGLIGLTHAMAVSAQRWGIRVNAISPGFISVGHECREGDEKGTTWEDRHADHEHALFPAGRVGRGEDIAQAVEFLAGAGYISKFVLTPLLFSSFSLFFSFSFSLARSLIAIMAWVGMVKTVC